MMLPQLFINYKLKSVAHLPWRQMTYKFLNTIIDDLFAFVIKMPTLHRLSVFRDGANILLSISLLSVNFFSWTGVPGLASLVGIYHLIYISIELFSAADLVFLIYLYQRWIYPVDKKRVNEFGFAGDDDKGSDVTATQQDEKKTN